MSAFTIYLLYGFITLFALLAPYLLLAFLASGRIWMWPIGVILFVAILTFLPPPVALFSFGLALLGIAALLAKTIYQWISQKRRLGALTP
ncbi:hypothetical protein [Ferrimonas marina]|uniref:Uncharacterized protein n=1 Tax=Ferrimonas marina TaxID=299255 RepID=A0A1M5WZ85_9GAMM|nr:hypothetical protein [Ferrimonas marina]SHH92996.1 hypothetical protein SAMN02745129_3110 [Ferrimonas marina]